MEPLKRITRDPQVMGGKPCIRGMRVTVGTVVGLRLDLEAQLYRLQGRVRWARDEGRHFLGVKIDQDSPDIGAWNQMFELEY